MNPVTKISETNLPDQRREFSDRSLDRQKYLDMVKTQGLTAAISALHHEKEQLEYATFEGSNGYNPELWAIVQEYCDFSRELWDKAMEQNPNAGF